MFDYLIDQGWYSAVIVLMALGLTVLISQFIKFLRNPGLKNVLLRDGGMPSTHAAIIGSVLCGIFCINGFSMTFVLGCAIGLIILRDASGVRYAVGENAKVLKNVVPASQKERVVVDEGHRIGQIAVGFVLGVVISLIMVLVAGVSIF